MYTGNLLISTRKTWPWLIVKHYWWGIKILNWIFFHGHLMTRQCFVFILHLWYTAYALNNGTSDQLLIMWCKLRCKLDTVSRRRCSHSSVHTVLSWGRVSWVTVLCDVNTIHTFLCNAFRTKNIPIHASGVVENCYYFSFIQWLRTDWTSSDCAFATTTSITGIRFLLSYMYMSSSFLYANIHFQLTF